MAFFLTNPTLNPALLVFLLLTLGWQWSLLRLVMGIALILAVAFAVSRVGFAARARLAEAHPEEVVDIRQKEEHRLSQGYGSWVSRWARSLAKLSATLVPEYLITVLVLGGVRAFLFPAAGPDLGNTLPVVVGLAVAGTVFAIPTAGEIPIIQTMLGFGVGAGPAGALLLTLAPVSLPSLLMVSRVFPKRALMTMGVLVVCTGVLTGVVAIALGL